MAPEASEAVPWGWLILSWGWEGLEGNPVQPAPWVLQPQGGAPRQVFQDGELALGPGGVCPACILVAVSCKGAESLRWGWKSPLAPGLPHVLLPVACEVGSPLGRWGVFLGKF